MERGRFRSCWAHAILLGLGLCSTQQVFAAGTLDLELNAAYNLVVDSNVCSPPTYAPEVGTHSVKICNNGDAPLTGVVAYVGDHANRTPGLYPERDSTTGGPLCAQSALLCDSGSYSLTHLGQLVDATRVVGTLGVGQCSVQYWSFTYPRVSNDDASCTPVWGESNDPNDDLSLDYDIWVSSAEGIESDTGQTVTMRNEISASANKIYPNNGLWFNEPVECGPGSIVTTSGINYELGVVNQGFDNDGDGEYDYNGWLQPIGDASWDPSCFRLVSSSGQLQIKRPGAPDEIVNFEDQLYFTNLGDNSGITGVVEYKFLCLNGICQVPLTPYQEAASGADNEKFAGDYGTSTTTITTTLPEVRIDKFQEEAGAGGAVPGRAEDGERLNYEITIVNQGDEESGVPAFGAGLVIRDSLPPFTNYVAGSASVVFSGLANDIVILFSDDNGNSWSIIEPPADTVTDIQWRLQDPLPPLSAAPDNEVTVGFSVTLESPYLGDPIIVNTAGVSVGDAPPFDEDSTAIPYAGPNSIGDFVFVDTDIDGTLDPGEPGIDGVDVTLYWDGNGNGVLDDGDLALETQESGGVGGTGGYLFTDLSDGDYIVQVNDRDDALDAGNRISTPDPSNPESVVAVTNLGEGVAGAVARLDVDFGFAPSILVTKTRVTPAVTDPDTAVVETGEVVYEISLTNTRPTVDQCVFQLWGEGFSAADSNALDAENAAGSQGPDDLFATLGEGGGGDDLRIDTFSPGPYPGNITLVEVLVRLRIAGTVIDDDLDIQVFDGAADLATALNVPADELNGNASNQWYLWSGDVTNLADTGLWTLAELPLAYIDLDYKHVGGSEDTPLQVDAVGFRIITDAACGAPNDNMSVVPLLDTFDDNYLTFETALDCGTSATVPTSPVCGDGNDVTDLPDDVATAGQLLWENVGPLDAGRTVTYQLTFTANLPAPPIPPQLEDDPFTTVNTATNDNPSLAGNPARNGTFVDGFPINEDTDTADVEIIPAGSISGFVFNNNCVAPAVCTDDFDPSEQGIPNVTVTLYFDNNDNGILDGGDTAVPIAPEVTDATGAYAFVGLGDPGNYVAVVDTATLPAGFSADFDPDSNLNNESGTAGFPSPLDYIQPGDGDEDNNDLENLNFGYLIPNSVYGYLYEDVAGDGIIDETDNPLSGVTVELYLDVGADGIYDPLVEGTVPLLSDLTDALGYYNLGAIADSGNSYVLYVNRDPGSPIEAADGWAPTFDPDTFDSNTDPANDFGGVVQLDINGDPIVPIAAQAISGGNLYGNYDFAYTQTGASGISGIVYADWNGDADIDVGELGFEQITVTLYEDENNNGLVDPEDAVIATVLSGDDPNTPTAEPLGFYSFTDLPAGDYLVLVDAADLPGGFSQTEDYDEPGGVCTVCSNSATTFTVDGLNDVPDIDFGYLPSGAGSIGDYVWLDADGDGIQDETEDGLVNMTVALYHDSDGDGLLDLTQDAFISMIATAIAGEYTFYNLAIELPSGQAFGKGLGGGGVPYIVDIDVADPQLPRDVLDNPYVLSSGDEQFATTLSDLEPVELDADFGFAPGGRVGDLVFIDSNGNGDFDGADTGIPDITVTLHDSYSDENGNGQYDEGTDILGPAVLTTVTGDNPDTVAIETGFYLFAGLPPGDYYVKVDIADAEFPANHEQTADPDIIFESETAVTVIANAGITSADFGYQPPGTISGTLWYETADPLDAANFGILNGSDTPLGGITVELVGTGITTTTNPDGSYTFTNIASGSYTVSVVTATLPAGVTQVFEADGDAPDNDFSVSVTVVNDDVTGVDFAYQGPAQLVIDKDTSTPTVNLGGVAQYSILVRNLGGQAASNVVVTDTLPGAGNFTYGSNVSILDQDGITVAVGALPNAGDTTLTWAIVPDIQPGASVTITFTANVSTSTALGTYDNTAAATADGGISIDDDGTVGQDPGTPTAQDPEADEDVTIASLPVLEITKLSDSGDGVNCFADGDPTNVPGPTAPFTTNFDGVIDGNGDTVIDTTIPETTLEYCVVVRNTGNVTANDITVTDSLPPGLVDNGASTLESITLTQTYADNIDFDGAPDSAFPGGNDGARSFAGDWLFTVNNGGNFAGLVTDGDNAISLIKTGATERSLQILAADSITVSLETRHLNFEADDDFFVFLTCGGTTQLLGEVDGLVGTAPDYTPRSFTTTALLAPTLFAQLPATCVLRLDLIADNSDEIRIDDIQVDVSTDSTAGGITGGTPPLLIAESDGIDLAPGRFVAIRIPAAVDDLTGISTLTNTATARSIEVDPVSDSVTDTVTSGDDGEIGNLVWDDADGDGIFNNGEEGLAGIRVELYLCVAGNCNDLQFVTAKVTDGAGGYLFQNLPDATYVVSVDPTTLPASYFPTTKDPADPGDETADNVSKATPFQVTLSLGAKQDGMAKAQSVLYADFGYDEDLTTVPVTLASINTREEGDELVIEWSTVTETGNVGFYLYGEVGGKWVELTDGMVPSRAISTTEPQFYELRIPKRKVAAVAIADVDVLGRVTGHGPFTKAEMERMKPPTLQPVGWPKIHAEQKALAAKRMAAKAGGPMLARFSVASEGVYRVTYDDLLAAGLDVAGVHVRDLSLHDFSGEVPIQVSANGRFGPGDSIEFVGVPIDTLYSKTNVYTLRTDGSGEGLRIASASGRPGRAPLLSAAPHTVVHAPNNGYDFISPVGDPWYDERILTYRTPRVTTRSLAVADLAPGAGQGEVTVDLWGLTDWPTIAPDHHVRVYVGGVEVHDEAFDGQQARVITAEVPSELLAAGSVDVQLEVVGDLENPYNIVVLEATSLSYSRSLVAPDGALVFDGEADFDYEVSDLPDGDPVVYRVDPAGVSSVRVDVDKRGGTYSARIAAGDAAARYYLADAAGLVSPEITVSYQPDTLPEGPIDYLVISHPSFVDGVKPLVDLRAAEGYETAIVTTEQVYEVYSGAVPDAEAIQAYVTDAVEQQGVNYVMLVGGDTFDYQDYLGLGSVSFVPSLYRRSGPIVNYAPADALVGAPDADGLPRVPVGRLPVRTLADLENIVGKIIDYSAKDYGRTIVAAADYADPVENISFINESEKLLSHLSGRWQITRAYLNDIGWSARQLLLDTLNSGVSLAQYFGHSSPSLWSRYGLLRAWDVDSMTNFGRPAVVVQWGCWNTYYVEPRYSTLGDALMLGSNTGAAAVIGAATLTETASDVALGSEFMPRLTQSRQTIGQALVSAKRVMATTHPEMMDVVIGWAILGDPAMIVDRQID